MRWLRESRGFIVSGEMLFGVNLLGPPRGPRSFDVGGWIHATQCTTNCRAGQEDSVGS